MTLPMLRSAVVLMGLCWSAVHAANPSVRGPAVPADLYGPDVPLLTLSGSGDGAVLLVNRSGRTGFTPIDEPYVALRAAMLRNEDLLDTFLGHAFGQGVLRSPGDSGAIRAADRELLRHYRELLAPYVLEVGRTMSSSLKRRIAMERDVERLTEEVLREIPPFSAPWYRRPVASHPTRSE